MILVMYYNEMKTIHESEVMGVGGEVEGKLFFSE